MKKTINGTTYDTDKADESALFDSADSSAELNICFYRNGTILLEELLYAPEDADTKVPDKDVHTVRQLTRRQAVEVCVEHLMPGALRPDFRRLLKAKPAPPRKRRSATTKHRPAKKRVRASAPPR